MYLVRFSLRQYPPSSSPCLLSCSKRRASDITPEPSRSSFSRQDIRQLETNHIRRHSRPCAGRARENRRISHTQTFDTPNTELGVDTGIAVPLGPHATATSRVMTKSLVLERLPKILAGSRAHYRDGRPGLARLAEEVQGQLASLYEGLEVPLASVADEIIEVNHRCITRVAGTQRDTPSGIATGAGHLCQGPGEGSRRSCRSRKARIESRDCGSRGTVEPQIRMLVFTHAGAIYQRQRGCSFAVWSSATQQPLLVAWVTGPELECAILGVAIPVDSCIADDCSFIVILQEGPLENIS